MSDVRLERQLVWRPFICVIGLAVVALQSGLRGADLSYFLSGEISYDENLPTPADHFGFAPGDRHLYHHELTSYMRRLAEASPRLRAYEYARSYGGRPLLLLVVSSPENMEREEEIRIRHRRLIDPDSTQGVRLKSLPVIVYLGFGVHGDEASASNVAPLVAYHLAAAQDEAIVKQLEKMVVLLDPSLNPDGMDRFAQWVNSNRGNIPIADSSHREHVQGWPKGRSNYYWFDLNRDWLFAQHPESQGRLREFHRWKPDLLGDFHEMRTNMSYFFQPGVTERINPLIPESVVRLTKRLAGYHAKALDKVSSYYFTEERFDDFYVGKGSTYVDLQGGIGLLFEQGSARGQVQGSDNGELTFPFAMRNQYLIALATLDAAFDLREDLLRHKRDFFAEAIAEAETGGVYAHIVSAGGDRMRLRRFLDLLDAHQIRAFKLRRDVVVGDDLFEAGTSALIPTAQRQSRYIRTLFEKRTSFVESVFYDVSTWTLPPAFDLQYGVIGEPLSDSILGEAITLDQQTEGIWEGGRDGLAYLIEWSDLYAPRLLYRLLDRGYRVKAAMKPIVTYVGDTSREFSYGTLLIQTGQQNESLTELRTLLSDSVNGEGTRVFSISTGMTQEGPDLGSSEFAMVAKPDLLMVVGGGISENAAGEIWHLLDRRYQIPVTLVEDRRLSTVPLKDYSTVILPGGDFETFPETSIRALRSYIESGGTLISVGTAVDLVAKAKLAGIEKISGDNGSGDPATALNGSRPELPERRAYEDGAHDAALKLVRGAIFRTKVDLSHPLGYGFPDDELPVFRTHRHFVASSRNPYATPMVYTAEPLLSGYISSQNLEKLRNSAAAVVYREGKGRVIVIADRLAFRAGWYGTNRLLANAVFFSPLIDEPKVKNQKMGR